MDRRRVLREEPAGWLFGQQLDRLVSCDLATIEGPASGFNCFDPLGGILGGVLEQQFKTTYLNRALYAQGTYNFNEKRSEEHTSELQSLMRISYAVFCLKKKNT